MAFKISFHVTVVAKEGFETVVFPTEEKTTEKFQSLRHLNNTLCQNSSFIKYTSTSHPKRLHGSSPHFPPQKNFILLRVGV
jgi:hypothetical protein